MFKKTQLWYGPSGYAFSRGWIIKSIYSLFILTHTVLWRISGHGMFSKILVDVKTYLTNLKEIKWKINNITPNELFIKGK